VPCKRCNAALSFAEARPALRALLAGPAEAAPAPATGVRESASPTGVGTRAGVEVPPPPAAGGRRMVTIVAGALVVGVLAAAWLLLQKEPGEARVPAASTSTAVPPPPLPSASPSEPPAWATPGILVEGDQVDAVGRGVGATEESALAAARSDAIDRLAARLLEDLAGTPVHAFVAPRIPRDPDGARRAESLAAVADRYLAQVGATSAPERVDQWAQKKGGEVSIVARYRLRKQAYAAALATYKRTETAAGMTVAALFPLLERSLRTQGHVIVVSVEKGGAAAGAGVREGDVVLALAGAATTSLDAFAGALSSAGAGPIEARIEDGGAARAVKLRAK
jgi:hypothetical protein